MPFCFSQAERPLKAVSLACSRCLYWLSLCQGECGTATQHPQLARTVTSKSSGLRGKGNAKQEQCHTGAGLEPTQHAPSCGWVTWFHPEARRGLATCWMLRAADLVCGHRGCPRASLGRPSVGTSAAQASQPGEARGSLGTKSVSRFSERAPQARP